MTVAELLPRVRANRYTYHNLDKQTIEAFQIQYNYLKKHKSKKIFLSVMNSVNHWLNLENELDYLKKIRAIQCISTNIEHNTKF